VPVREWDGSSYDRISGVMQSMGLEVLSRLELAGGETVIDAGCGSGRVTEALLERLPRGRVVGVDESASMIASARERLGPGVELVVADLLELEVDQPADAILSTATFHWIGDHERLFRRLRACLRPGGRLLAQCGGEGNITELRRRAMIAGEREPYGAHLRSFRAPWNYAAPDVTRERLLAAGFASAEAWLQPAPQQPEHPREFLETIVLQPHVQALPAELRAPFMDDVLAELGEPVVVDYVRLNIDAGA